MMEGMKKAEVEAEVEVKIDIEGLGRIWLKSTN